MIFLNYVTVKITIYTDILSFNSSVNTWVHKYIITLFWSKYFKMMHYWMHDKFDFDFILIIGRRYYHLSTIACLIFWLPVSVWNRVLHSTLIIIMFSILYRIFIDISIELFLYQSSNYNIILCHDGKV